MSAETMLTFLQRATPEEKLGFQVATQCAPVLKGVKLSNLITVKAGCWQKIRRFLRQSRVICVPLYMDGEKEVLYLYRYERLVQYLQRKEVREFLQHYGYEQYDIAAVLRRLRGRYQEYAGAGKHFPHELGVLLEYPLEDVESFIANQGENSLTVRYWKVYHNPQQAEQTFRVYDEAKEQALTEIMRGYPLWRVAV